MLFLKTQKLRGNIKEIAENIKKNLFLLLKKLFFY